MAVRPMRTAHAPPVALTRFRKEHAAAVASWVGSATEAQWLAPRTPPPITAERVVSWQEVGRQAFELRTPEVGAPIGYGELNALQRYRREYWLGHLIVAPSHRGLGLGVRLTRLLLERAFYWHGARRVVLVVFREYERAIAIYRAAGMVPDGHEEHYFGPYRQEVRLLRMVSNRI